MEEDVTFITPRFPGDSLGAELKYSTLLYVTHGYSSNNNIIHTIFIGKGQYGN